METALRKHLPGGSFGCVHPAHSRRMAAIRGKHTKPEMLVRRLVHGLGYRYRLHVHTLPGTPDLVFPAQRKIIEVKGCFWHMHSCPASHIPARRRAFWSAKLARTKARDSHTRRALRRLGWDVLVVWECQTRNVSHLKVRLEDFLEHGRAAPTRDLKRDNVLAIATLVADPSRFDPSPGDR
jgi:DNA mismatch endonuclease (patch repair protein)